MKSIFILLDSIITIYLWIIIINALLSWLVAFNILNTQNRFVFSVLEATYKLTDPLTNHKVLEKAWREDEILSFGTAKEWAQLLSTELIYPAESMLVLPVKRVQNVIGLLVMTDPKRHVYTKNIMTMV